MLSRYAGSDSFWIILKQFQFALSFPTSLLFLHSTYAVGGGGGYCCRCCNYHHYHSTILIIIIIHIILMWFNSTVYTKQQEIHMFSLNITAILHSKPATCVDYWQQPTSGRPQKKELFTAALVVEMLNITNVVLYNVYNMQYMQHH